MKSENYQSSTACLVLKRSDRLVCRNAFGSETNEENCSKFFDWDAVESKVSLCPCVSVDDTIQQRKPQDGGDSGLITQSVQ